ncbi:MAG: serine/threonine protein kinase, partial [Clostridia bacterium]|nr:serine/threonine protein kinase [Clostridia bacterium]
MSDIRDFEPLFGEWKIEEKLGAGSYGSVYSAVRTEFGREYRSAIKHISIPANRDELRAVYQEGYAHDEQSARRYYEQFLGGLLEEINLMYRLRGNTNIVTYEDHKIIEKQDIPGFDVFIRMELLKNLYEAMENMPVTRQEVCRLGIDICTALEVLGKAHIVHRDIKPANILVNDLGDYKLADFGVARRMERSATVMSVKGTYTYMAPEVFKGETAGTGADIYSLGLVLYRLLNNNRAPFLPAHAENVSYADNENALGRRLRGETLPLPGLVDARLGEIILTACAYRKEDRYPTPTAFKQALLAYVPRPEGVTLHTAAPQVAPGAEDGDRTVKFAPTVNA